MKFVNYFFVVLFSFCFSCSRVIPELDIENDKINGIVRISKWQFIGPFIYDTLNVRPEQTFETDELKNFGLHEDSLSFKSILQIKAGRAINKNLLSQNFVNKKFKSETVGVSDFSDLFKFNDIKQLRKMSNVYLACNIRTPKAMAVCFVTFSCCGSKIWVNNHLVLSENGKTKKGKNYDHCTNVSLK